MAYNSTSTYSPYPDPSTFPAAVLPLDVALLTALCAIQGKSGDEGDMQAFILDFLTGQGLSPHSDANGNITCVKGQAAAYPCLVAHLDTVHLRYAGYAAARSVDGRVLYAYANTVARVNENLPLLSVTAGRTQVGVGGDDRCGLYLALHLLTHLPAVKVAFFVEEEIGARRGSGFADLAFFADTTVVLQGDRKGHDDWVQTVSGTQVSSNAFVDSIRDLLVARRYTVTQQGGFTDVGELKRRGLGVCAANLSCGYYHPHSDTETIFLPALENTLNLCLEVIQRVGGVPQPHAHLAPSYARTNQALRPLPVPAAYQQAKDDPFSNFNFHTADYGWSYYSAAQLAQVFGLKTRVHGGYCKVVNDVRHGPLQPYSIREYERAAAAKKAADEAAVAADQGKKRRQAVKDWVATDGTWAYQRTPVKTWVKYLSDGPGEAFFPVAYAPKLLDIPAEEKEFHFQWDGCYGVDPDSLDEAADKETAFTAEQISAYVNDVRQEQAAARAKLDQQSRTLPLPFAREEPFSSYLDQDDDDPGYTRNWRTSGQQAWD